MSGYPVDTIEMIEVHGTATTVGDVVEVSALKRAFGNLGSSGKNYCGLTSVKSNIGHLKSAAGIAGLIKAVLAIHHQVLPPTASFQEINPKLQLQDSPFYILDEAREWSASKTHPRRANVSAFGFGGADYHLALEEYRDEDYRRTTGVGFAAAQGRAVPAPAQEQAPAETAADLLFFSGANRIELEAQVKAFAARVRQRPDLPFAEHCSLHNYTVSAGQETRLALIASSLEELESRYAFFASNVDRIDAELLRAKGIFFGQGEPTPPEATAILFPGQASQYPGMFRNLYERHGAIRAWFSRADAFWFARHDHTITSLVFPPPRSRRRPGNGCARRRTLTPAYSSPAWPCTTYYGTWDWMPGTWPVTAWER